MTSKFRLRKLWELGGKLGREIKLRKNNLDAAAQTELGERALPIRSSNNVRSRLLHRERLEEPKRPEAKVRKRGGKKDQTPLQENCAITLYLVQGNGEHLAEGMRLAGRHKSIKLVPAERTQVLVQVGDLLAVDSQKKK